MWGDVKVDSIAISLALSHACADVLNTTIVALSLAATYGTSSAASLDESSFVQARHCSWPPRCIVSVGNTADIQFNGMLLVSFGPDSQVRAKQKALFVLPPGRLR